MENLPVREEGMNMIAWYLVILLCIVDGTLCHALIKAWDELHKEREEDRDGNGNDRSDCT